MTLRRDDLLIAALRDLEVPEHRPEFHRELQRRLRAERRAEQRRAYRIRYAALAAVAIAVGLYLGTMRGGGSTANAAVVQAKMRAALAGFRNVSGELVESGPTRPRTVRARFVLDALGDMRIEGPRPGDVLVFDAARLTYRWHRPTGRPSSHGGSRPDTGCSASRATSTSGGSSTSAGSCRSSSRSARAPSTGPRRTDCPTRRRCDTG